MSTYTDKPARPDITEQMVRNACASVSWEIREDYMRAALEAAIPAPSQDVAGILDRMQSEIKIRSDHPDDYDQEITEMWQEAADALSRLASGAGNAPEGWQLIETAPKSGSFLIANELGQVCACSSHDGQRIVHNHVGYADWSMMHRATHWAPFPTAPNTAASPSLAPDVVEDIRMVRFVRKELPPMLIEDDDANAGYTAALDRVNNATDRDIRKAEIDKDLRTRPSAPPHQPAAVPGREIDALIDATKAFLDFFNPFDLAEDKSRQWFSVRDQLDRIARLTPTLRLADQRGGS